MHGKGDQRFGLAVRAAGKVAIAENRKGAEHAQVDGNGDQERDPLSSVAVRSSDKRTLYITFW